MTFDLLMEFLDAPTVTEDLQNAENVKIVYAEPIFEPKFQKIDDSKIKYQRDYVFFGDYYNRQISQEPVQFEVTLSYSCNLERDESGGWVALNDEYYNIEIQQGGSYEIFKLPPKSFSIVTAEIEKYIMSNNFKHSDYRNVKGFSHPVHDLEQHLHKL